ncbi:MAG: SPOR domain-containing protein [Tannerella sp.]|nr:SPOR domain-containing protein [Tannerella sp.]
MKNRLLSIIFISAIMLSGHHLSCAQSPYFSIFDSFETASKPGAGVVIIHQPESLKQLVGTRIDSENIDVVNGKTYLITEGYRVQVYSGNNQRTSKGEAMDKKKKINEIYPDVRAYVTYNAPFWKLHIGDYRSYEEASHMLRSLRETFPQTRNEIYIIEDGIRLLLD